MFESIRATNSEKREKLHCCVFWLLSLFNLVLRFFFGIYSDDKKKREIIEGSKCFFFGCQLTLEGLDQGSRIRVRRREFLGPLR